MEDFGGVNELLIRIKNYKVQGKQQDLAEFKLPHPKSLSIWRGTLKS
jgi:hypothetical protein